MTAFVVGWQLARAAGWRRCGSSVKVVLKLMVVIYIASKVRAVEKEEEGEDIQQAKDKQRQGRSTSIGCKFDGKLEIIARTYTSVVISTCS